MKPLTPELLLAAMDAGQTVQRDQTLPITDWADGERVAQAIVALRRARGDRPIGWKVGLTNLSAWPRLGIDRPIWGRIYDRTVTLLDSTRAELFLDGLSTPRIEPEIVVGLARTPAADTPLALIEACAWIAHGFEIVHTPYPDWRSVPMESHAAQAMHAALIVGPRLRPDQLADSPAALACPRDLHTHHAPRGRRALVRSWCGGNGKPACLAWPARARTRRARRTARNRRCHHHRHAY
jgi:2-oxo-3-hexenedioate decarboxylase